MQKKKKCTLVGLLSLQQTKKLDWPKFEAFADYKIDVTHTHTQKMKIVSTRIENIMEKRRKCWVPVFSPFFYNNVFKKLHMVGQIRDCVVKGYCMYCYQCRYHPYYHYHHDLELNLLFPNKIITPMKSKTSFLGRKSKSSVQKSRSFRWTGPRLFQKKNVLTASRVFRTKQAYKYLSSQGMFCKTF